MPGKFTQIDGFAAASPLCFLVAMVPGTPSLPAAIAATLLSFVLLGLIWTAALRPAGDPSLIAGAVTAVAAVFAAGIVGGLLLNFLPGGLNRTSWLGYALILCAAGYFVARVRGRQTLFMGRITDVTMPSGRTALKFGVACALLVATVVVSVNSTYAKDKPFTELWLLPNNPTNSPVRAIDATLGVQNRERTEQRYTLVFDSGTQVFTSKILLAPDAEMTKKVYIENDEATATLYRGDSADGEPYRKVWIARR